MTSEEVRVAELREMAAKLRAAARRMLDQVAAGCCVDFRNTLDAVEEAQVHAARLDVTADEGDERLRRARG